MTPRQFHPSARYAITHLSADGREGPSAVPRNDDDGRRVNSIPRHGLILTRHWRDTPQGTEIDFWLATDDGPRRVCLTRQRSTAFAQVEDRAAIEAAIAKMPEITLQDLPLKTFQQKPVIGIYAGHYRQLLKLERDLEQQGIRL